MEQGISLKVWFKSLNTFYKGFSRISAVNGGVFILNENISITKMEETQKEDGKVGWKIYTPLAGDA